MPASDRRILLCVLEVALLLGVHFFSAAPEPELEDVLLKSGRKVLSDPETKGVLCPPTLGEHPAICNLRGPGIFSESAADLLAAARYAPGVCKDDSGSKICTTDNITSWIMADYMLSLTATQAKVDSKKSLVATGQVDLFLCSDPACTVAADMQKIRPRNSDNATWAMGVTQVPGALTSFPAGIIEAAKLVGKRTTRDWNVSVPNGIDVSKQTGIQEVNWEVDQPQWFDGPPVLMPLGTLARTLINDSRLFESLRFGTYNVRDLYRNESACAIIITPQHQWMDEHGWNASENCTPQKDAAVYLFDSYLPVGHILNDMLSSSVKGGADRNASFAGHSACSGQGEVPCNTKREVYSMNTSGSLPASSWDSGMYLKPGRGRSLNSAATIGSYGLTLSCTDPKLHLNQLTMSDCRVVTHEMAGCMGPLNSNEPYEFDHDSVTPLRRCVPLLVGTAAITAWRIEVKTDSSEDQSFLDKLVYSASGEAIWSAGLQSLVDKGNATTSDISKMASKLSLERYNADWQPHYLRLTKLSNMSTLPWCLGWFDWNTSHSFEGDPQLKFEVEFDKKKYMNVAHLNAECCKEGSQFTEVELLLPIGLHGLGLPPAQLHGASGQGSKGGYSAMDCEFWDALDLGYASPGIGSNGPAVISGDGPVLQAAARPLKDLLQQKWVNLEERGIDLQSRSNLSSAANSFYTAYLPAAGFYDAISTYGELIPDGLNRSIQRLVLDATRMVGVQAVQQLATMDSIKTVQGCLIDLTILIVSIVAMATSVDSLDGFFARKLWLSGQLSERGLFEWRVLLVKVLSCSVVVMGLVLAPIIALHSEQTAKSQNPKGDENDIAWLSADAGSGEGPYTIVAAVVINIKADDDPAALHLLQFNLVLASISAFWIIFVSLWRQRRSAAATAAAVDEHGSNGHSQQQHSGDVTIKVSSEDGAAEDWADAGATKDVVATRPPPLTSSSSRKDHEAQPIPPYNQDNAQSLRIRYQTPSHGGT